MKFQNPIWDLKCEKKKKKKNKHAASLSLVMSETVFLLMTEQKRRRIMTDIAVIYFQNQMSHVMRKPANSICEQQRRRSAICNNDLDVNIGQVTNLLTPLPHMYKFPYFIGNFRSLSEQAK